jgi:effector-binding domain-containing protein
MTETEVRTETRAAQPALSLRSVVAIGDIGRTHGEKFAALTDLLRRHGLTPAGPPFVRYHTFTEQDTDAEVGVPLTAPAAAPEAGELPGGTMLVTWHDGPDQALGEAYGRIGAALAAGGHQPRGAAWEVYHWMDLATGETDGPRRIELVQPVS